MNLHSFRSKIALLSGLITCGLLLGSELVLWSVSYRFNLDRLDREIRNIGQSNLDRVIGGDHWSRLQDALKFISGDKPATDYVLWVRIYDRVVYQSASWPPGISATDFPPLVQYEKSDAVKPGQPLPPPPRRGEEISPSNPALPRKKAEFYTRSFAGKTWRFGVMGNPYVTLILGGNLGGFNEQMNELRNTFLATLPIVLLLAVGGAWLVARRALRPVTALTQAAETVTARGQNQRIPAMHEDEEFNRLITVFNEMLDRLEESFQQATRFSADASHELKTPLARIQLELEQAFDSAPPGSPSAQVYSSLLDEVGRLKSIIQKLLLLSLADAGQLVLRLQPVDLSGMLSNVVEDCLALAPTIKIEQTIPAGLLVNADADLLEQALQNLSSNAIKYNTPSGLIRFYLSTDDLSISLRISNTGIPIPSTDYERIFERFYRADPSRSDRVEGTGLGLSLAREIVAAHGGTLRLESTGQQMNCFVLSLPVPA